MIPANIFLPDPEPDEMLHSVLIVGHRLSGYANMKDFTRSLFGMDVDGRTWTVKYQRLAKHLNSCRSTGTAILQNTLNVPYLIPFMTEHSLAFHCLSNAKLDPAKRYADNINKGARSALSYCPMCVKRQLGMYRRTFWERSHQLRLVTTCWRHGTKLIVAHQNSSAPWLPSEFEDQTVEYVFDKNEVWLARQSRALLLGNYGPSDRKAMTALYRSRAIRLGYTNGNRIDYAAMAEDLRKRFGDKFLMRTMEFADIKDLSKHLHETVNAKLSAAYPIRHLFCIEVLFGDQRLFFKMLAALTHAQRNPGAAASKILPSIPGVVHKQIFFTEMQKSGQNVMVELIKNYPLTHSWILSHALTWARRKIAALEPAGMQRPSQRRLAAKHRKFSEEVEEQKSRRSVQSFVEEKVLAAAFGGPKTAQAFSRISSELRRA